VLGNVRLGRATSSIYENAVEGVTQAAAGRSLEVGPGLVEIVRQAGQGLSQTELGKAVGVTFQQVQKYENGANRVSASCLQQIANVLKVRPDFFFDGVSTKAVGDPSARDTAVIEVFISSRDSVSLSKAFANIRDSKTRRSIVALVEQIAAGT
jgi:transcriptional regulator with XRE-family HTH domain